MKKLLLSLTSVSMLTLAACSGPYGGSGFNTADPTTRAVGGALLGGGAGAAIGAMTRTGGSGVGLGALIGMAGGALAGYATRPDQQPYAGPPQPTYPQTYYENGNRQMLAPYRYQAVPADPGVSRW